ncbi:MAG: 50S ribosomal protein L1 [Myxococcales bacterium]|nr:50S ribosomal protein L1 [Myxococcales bacterium]
MTRTTKNTAAARAKVDRARNYSLEEAVGLVKDASFAKSDESVDLAIRLGVDPRHADQNIRGATILPHGTGKSARVVVFARGEKAMEAEAAGADVVGGEDLVEKIQKGWMDFDKTVATPDMMALVGRIGRVLGPRGMMPNPKLGTVTMDVTKAVGDLKGGKVEYRVEKAGIVHVPVGRVSFDADKLMENVRVVMGQLLRAKPSSQKGVYVKRISISSTQGPGITIDPQEMLSLNS